MAESKEFETVVHCSRDLETALKDDRDVVYYLHKEGFITGDMSDQILDSSSWTGAEKAGRLVAKIRDKVKLKSQEYHKLVDHFTKNKRQYGTIVETLNTEYNRRLGTTTASAPAISEQEFSRAHGILKGHAHVWKQIGQGLGFKFKELSKIEARPALFNTAPESYLDAMLSDWQEWFPGDNRGSSDSATLASLKSAVSKAGLGRTAQQLGESTTRKRSLEESDNGEPRPKKPRNVEIDGSEEEPEMEMPRFNEEEQKELFEEHAPEKVKKDDDDKIKEIKIFCEDIKYLILTFNDNEYQAGLSYLKPPSKNFKKAVLHLQPGMVVGLLAETEKVVLVRARQGTDVSDDVKDACKPYPKIKYIIGAGVCYAFNRKEVKLADVLISQKIADFTNTKIGEKEGDCKIKITDRGDRKKIDPYLEKWFFHDDGPLTKYKVTKKGRFYQVKHGLIISPPLLVNNKSFRDALHDAAPEAIGGEMEGGELMKYSKSLGVIIIKGVCDYADGKKDKKWQFTAAMAAFDYIEQKMSMLP